MLFNDILLNRHKYKYIYINTHDYTDVVINTHRYFENVKICPKETNAYNRLNFIFCQVQKCPTKQNAYDLLDLKLCAQDLLWRSFVPVFFSSVSRL